MGRGAVAAAVLLAVADRQHHEGVLQLAVIGGDAQTVPEGAAHGLENRQRVGRCAAAEGHAPPFGDAVGDLGVDARGIDVDAAALGRADDVRCERLCGQLCVKVQELRLRAEVAHIVIAAAAGHAADGGVRVTDGTLQYFVQRAVAAAGVEVYFFPAGGVLGGQVAGLPGAAGHLNGRMKPCAAGSGVDLRDERHAGVHLARRWVYDKNMLHRFVPFSIGCLRSTDTNYCSFFAAKVQYLGGNWLTKRLASPSGEAVSGPDH